MAAKVSPEIVRHKPAAKTTPAAGTRPVKSTAVKRGKPAVVAQGDQFVRGEKPQAPRLAQQVRARGFANSAAAAMGRGVVTTAAAALNDLVQLNAKSPSAAAELLQRMALPHLTPDKGNV